MPRNGAGVFSLVNNTWFPPVNGVLATATDWTPFITDIQNALTQSVSSDGQTPFTGNLPMGNNKITGLANGTALTDAAAFGQVGRYAGNCRLIKSGANLLLIPFNGNQITINGGLQVIPAGGVSLSPTGTPATLYYIYAYMVATTMTLEASTTVHAQDATTGVEIKSGDATRTLVGMARPIAGPAWQDTTNQRFVVSWYNRIPVQIQAVLGTATAISGAAYGEISATLRTEFLTWANSSVNSSFQGNAIISNANSVASTTLPLDSVTGTYESFSSAQAYGANAFVNPYCSLIVVPSEGYHLITPLALVAGGGTATYAGGATPGQRCVNSGFFMG